MDSDAQSRAARRRQHAGDWPVRMYRVGEEPVRDPLDRSSVDERIRSMWPLAKQAWAVAGQAIPKYDRRQAPGEITRNER